MASTKRPTYIELINAYWSIYEKAHLTANDTLLYFLLLKEANRLRWENPFPYPSRNLEIYSGMPRKSINESRNRLKQAGLIDFTQGKGKGNSPSYALLQVTQKVTQNDFSVTTSNTKSNTKGNTKGNAKGNAKGNTYNKNIRQEDNVSLTRDSALAREEDYLERFFRVENTSQLEALMMQFCMKAGSVAELRKLAETVVGEWSLSETVHRDYTDWSSHLIATMRIKNNDKKKNNDTTSISQRRRVESIAPSAQDYKKGF